MPYEEEEDEVNRDRVRHKVNWRVGLSLLRHLAPVVCQVEHEVARQGVMDGFGAPLTVDEDVCTGKLAEDVETFETGNEGAGGCSSKGVGEGT